MFQNDVALCFESYWKKENAPDISFWGFNELTKKRKQKKNSGSVLTGRKHTKIVRLGASCLNRETHDKSGRLGRYAFPTT